MRFLLNFFKIKSLLDLEIPFLLDFRFKTMEWPWQYNFPPFYTLQPNADTRIKQLDAWCDLVQTYCKQHRLFQIDTTSAQKLELFSNKKIDRKCSLDLITDILNEMVKRNRALWLTETVSPKKSSQTQARRKCLILWNTLDQWANLIYAYVERNALHGTVCTFYELTEAKEIKNEPFYKIDLEVFRKSLAVLEKENKAEVFQLDGDSEYGVKFF